MALKDWDGILTDAEAEPILRTARTNAYDYKHGTYAYAALALLNRSNTERHVWEEQVTERRDAAVALVAKATPIEAGTFPDLSTRSGITPSDAQAALRRVMHLPIQYLMASHVLQAVNVLGRSDALVVQWQRNLTAKLAAEQAIIDNASDQLTTAPSA